MHFQLKTEKRLHANWKVSSLAEAKQYFIETDCNDRKHKKDWPIISNEWLLPKLMEIFSKIDGAILVCGPPGSGKSLRRVYKMIMSNFSMHCIINLIICQS